MRFCWLGVFALGTLGCGLTGSNGDGGFGNGGAPAGSQSSTGGSPPTSTGPIGIGGSGVGASGGMGGMGGSPPVEICQNGIDDDGNGKIDCADPACNSDPGCQFDWYVDPSNMMPTPDGTMGNPFTDIVSTVAMCNGMMSRRIFLAAATYPPITLPPNCSLTGSGRDKSVFDGQVVARPIDISDAGTAPGTTLVDLGVQEGSADFGGGIYAGAGNLSLKHVTIQTSHASQDGGGFYFSNVNVVLSDVEVSDNSASTAGGGGVLTGCPTATLTDVTLDGNTSASNTGGLSLNMNQPTSIATVLRLVATNNHAAQYGGGVYFSQGTFTVEQSRFLGNTNAYGGGVYSFSNSLTISDSLIADNSGTSDGGGLYLTGQADYLQQVTIAGNQSTGAAAVHCSPAAKGENLVIWGNVGMVAVTGCNFDPQYTDSQDTGSMVSVDPLFVMSSSGNYHLKPNSPVKNKGNPMTTTPTDLDGNPRSDGKPDLGCYEIQP